MTEEEKQQQIERGKLLVFDLCARLPYKVKLQKIGEPDTIYELYSLNVETLEICFWKYKGKSLNIAASDKLYRFGIQRYKPYLRPMSSMTEEEKSVLLLCNAFIEPYSTEYKVNFYNQYYLDYRDLIGKGLALPAPKGMYKI